ncbi:putative sugar nucleotidyl transferase [Paracnuella aquatica]|uniref:putative sugar nucleotidyl transferase n=1 Tax=Paracnuella aquatica TaxID=2268757 RepID=UPI000DEF7AF1|nr:putative sugar nucleotidyl transferase [Paracnuella aquatica]RPD51693.1 glucose-1-phosphate thymidylyltransferase [Paracnuella aquatica]
MKKIVFTEEFCQPEQLYPFTLTRQVQDIRIGILTIREKWEAHLGLNSYDKHEDDYKDLDRAMVVDAQSIGDDILYLIHGNILPTPKLVRAIKKLKPGECITAGGRESVAYCISKGEIENEHKIKITRSIEIDEEIREIRFPWHIFTLNAWAIAQDFELLTRKRTSQKLGPTNPASGSKNIFIEKGARINHAIFNAADGPIYIGKNATIMEGSLLRGPIAIGEGAVIKMGTRIYGATTIGPKCVVGGEIKNSVLFGCSNKAHDGYLGDSVIGEWCNLGAGTSNSNVKNTASGVQVWTPRGEVVVGLKCGLIMGDYSRTAINTSLNTGTVVGVSSNIFGAGLSPKYIPSFSWGFDGIERYRFDKACADIASWKALKDESLTSNEELILKHIYNHY